MGRTIAEELRDEGRAEGKQQTLLLQLRRKFGKKAITPALAAHVERTKDAQTLDEWLGNILGATTLEEVGVPIKK